MPERPENPPFRRVVRSPDATILESTGFPARSTVWCGRENSRPELLLTIPVETRRLGALAVLTKHVLAPGGGWRWGFEVKEWAR